MTEVTCDSDSRRPPPFEPLGMVDWEPRCFQHFVDIDVRYCETDSARHVNHVVYPMYLEHGLLALLADIGDSESSRFPFEHVTAELLVRYLAPSVFGESLRVGTRLTKVGRTSAIVEQAVFSGAYEVRAVSRTVVVRNRGNGSEQWTSDQRESLLAEIAATEAAAAQ